MRIFFIAMILTGLHAGAQTPADTAKRIQLKDITISPPAIEHHLDKTVVNLDQRPATEGTTVLEALQHLPGVHVTPDGQVTLAAGRNATVYIDGKPTYLSAADLVILLSGMSTNTIQRIEIMTNPPSKYDAGGTGAIINIIRRKNHKAGFNGSVNGSWIAGHYGQYRGGMTASYKNDRFNFFLNNTYGYGKTLSAGQLTSDIENVHGDLLTEKVSDNRSISIWKSWRPAAGIDFSVSSRSTLSLSATAGIGFTGNQVYSNLTTTNEQRVPTQLEDFSAMYRDHPYHYTTTLQWVRTLDTAGRNLTVDADYADFVFHPVRTNLGLLYDTSRQYTGETNTLMVERRRLRIYSAQADFTHPVRNGRWEAGFKTSYVAARNDNTVTPDTTQSSYQHNTEHIDAAYATLDHAFRRIEAQAGLRAEEDVLTDTVVRWRYFQLFPTLFLRYKTNPQNTLILRLGRRTDRPDYHEMIPFRRTLTSTLYFQGNPNLRPDVTWHGEIGWNWRNILSVTLMMDRDHDYMRTLPIVDSGDSTITRRPTNVQGHSWNLDMGYSSELTRWWTTDNTVSFFQNAFAGDPDSLWRADRGMLAVYMSTTNTFTLATHWAAEIDGEFDSGHRLISTWFGAYYQVNAALKWTKDKYSVSLNANDIFQSEGHHSTDHYTGLYQYGVPHTYSRWVSLNATYRFGSGKTTRATIRSSSQEEQRRAGG